MTGIADMHCDTILGIYREGKSLQSNDMHIDLHKLKKSGYILQNFASFIHLKKTETPFLTCLDMIDSFLCEIKAYDGEIQPVYNYNDIERCIKEKKIAAMLTVEEGGAAEGSLSKLRTLYRLGVRMLTLTWNYINELGYPNAVRADGSATDFNEPNTTNGLTKTGFEFVAEMERLGMIVDVSHLSDAGFYDVARCAKKPFVASHSNARALCSHKRNLTDEMIRIIANKGGVIGMNYEGEFLQQTDRLEDAVGTVDDIVRHVLHIGNIGGYECIGLGSDFDGINTNHDIKDASYMYLLEDRLKKAGVNSTQVEAIFNGNVLRLYKECL